MAKIPLPLLQWNLDFALGNHSFPIGGSFIGDCKQPHTSKEGEHVIKHRLTLLFFPELNLEWGDTKMENSMG